MMNPNRFTKLDNMSHSLPVLSGRVAWSEFLSFLNSMLPKCNTADTVLCRAEIESVHTGVIMRHGNN